MAPPAHPPVQAPASALAGALAAALLAGTALLGVGAALHPVLTGDAAAQLRVIADTAHWRPLHLAMLAGSALVVAGVWVRLVADRSGETAPLVATLATIATGLAVNAMNIAFMAGAGWHMAAMHRAGRPEVATLFEATHPIGLMAARVGNALVALGALALGWLEWRDAASPRWLAALAWLAAAGGLAGVILFDEASPATLGAVALLSAWQVATALRALRPRR